MKTSKKTKSTNNVFQRAETRKTNYIFHLTLNSIMIVFKQHKMCDDCYSVGEPSKESV